MSEKTTAVETMIELVVTTTEALGELAGLAGDHYGTDPDTLHWGHVGDAYRVKELVLQALAMAKGE